MRRDTLWYSVADLAARLDVHEQTIRRWIREGRIRAVRIGRTIRIGRTELTRLTAPIDPTDDETENRHGDH